MEKKKKYEGEGNVVMGNENRTVSHHKFGISFLVFVSRIVLIIQGAKERESERRTVTVFPLGCCCTRSPKLGAEAAQLGKPVVVGCEMAAIACG
jgi:hypothetical protein